MSFCLDTYLQQSDDYEIHASKAGFKDCAMIIRFKADELVYIKPGDEVLGVRVIGIPPIPIGFDKTKGTVFLPYTKPCHGTSVVELPINEEEVEKIEQENEIEEKIKEINPLEMTPIEALSFLYDLKKMIDEDI